MFKLGVEKSLIMKKNLSPPRIRGSAPIKQVLDMTVYFTLYIEVLVLVCDVTMSISPGLTSDITQVPLWGRLSLLLSGPGFPAGVTLTVRVISSLISSFYHLKYHTNVKIYHKLQS